MKINWMWPNTPENNIAPLYVMAWRLVFFPLVLLGRVLFAVGIGLGQVSLDEARRAWEETS